MRLRSEPHHIPSKNLGLEGDVAANFARLIAPVEDAFSDHPSFRHGCELEPDLLVTPPLPAGLPTGQVAKAYKVYVDAVSRVGEDPGH